jgi:hypothetical protein
MITPIKAENIPSKHLDLLDVVTGRKIINLCRFTWLTCEEMLNSCRERGIEQNQLFSLTPGPLLMELDSGLVLGFSNGEPRLNSIIIWVERNEVGETTEDLLSLDDELFLIEANNEEYSKDFWSDFIGEEISSVQIYKELPKNVLYEDLPNEVGLIIRFTSNKELLLSYETSDEPFDKDNVILFSN